MNTIGIKWVEKVVKGFLPFCLFTLLPLTAIAQQDEPLARKKISEAAAALKTMQCEFVQTKHLHMLHDKMVSQGKMYYLQGNCLRWEYTTPYSYVFVLNQDRVLLKNQQRRDIIDVNRNGVLMDMARLVMSSVTGTCLSDDKRFKSSISTTGGEWVATLLPQRKETRQIFREMVIHFSRKQAVVTKVELTDNNGDRTVIELKNIKTNETLSAQLFALEEVKKK